MSCRRKRRVKSSARFPFDVAVQVLDQPELERRAELFRTMDAAIASTLIEAMSADQQAEIFRQLGDVSVHG